MIEAAIKLRFADEKPKQCSQNLSSIQR